MPALASLAEITTRQAVYIEGLKTTNARAVLPFLKEMQADILVQIAKIDDPAGLSAKRLNELLRAVRVTINDGYSDYRKVWLEQMAEFSEYTAQFEAKALGKVVAHDFAAPTPAKLNAAIMAKPLSVHGVYEGALLDSMFASMPANTIRRVEGAIRLSSAQGQSTAKLMQRLRGTRAAKFTDGIMDISRREAELISRTSLAHVNNAAKEITWLANADVIEEMEFIATLDGRTSALCRGLSGRRFPVGKAPIPPLHINCRSSIQPVFNDGLDFLDSNGKQFARGADGVEYVSGNMSYYDWLKTQPAKFQDSAIGPERGDLLRNGGLSATRFSELSLDKNFNPLTLDDMRRLEPLAFDRAGM